MGAGGVGAGDEGGGSSSNSGSRPSPGRRKVDAKLRKTEKQLLGEKRKGLVKDSVIVELNKRVREERKQTAIAGEEMGRLVRGERMLTKKGRQVAKVVEEYAKKNEVRLQRKVEYLEVQIEKGKGEIKQSQAREDRQR